MINPLTPGTPAYPNPTQMYNPSSVPPPDYNPAAPGAQTYSTPDYYSNPPVPPVPQAPTQAPVPTVQSSVVQQVKTAQQQQPKQQQKKQQVAVQATTVTQQKKKQAPVQTKTQQTQQVKPPKQQQTQQVVKPSKQQQQKQQQQQQTTTTTFQQQQSNQESKIFVPKSSSQSHQNTVHYRLSPGVPDKIKNLNMTAVNKKEENHLDVSLYGEKLLIMPESKFNRKNNVQVIVPDGYSRRAVILTKRVGGQMLYTLYFLHLTTQDGQPARLPVQFKINC